MTIMTSILVLDLKKSSLYRMIEKGYPLLKVSETAIGFFQLFRINRTIMVSAITGTAAIAAGCSVQRALWATLAGWLLAVGGFSLDFFSDRDMDAQGPRAEIRLNPMASGRIHPQFGLVFSILFLGASFAVALTISPRLLPVWGLIFIVLLGLALHLFETPLMRAFTLGILQALYYIMGGLAGTLTPGIGIISCMFFFAMFGGRGMTDVRDFLQDQTTRVRTLPSRYGIRGTAYFSTGSLLIAYGLSAGAWLTGEFSRYYLYMIIPFIVLGLVCIGIFLKWTTPRVANALTSVFMIGEGSLICAAVIMGTLVK
jgi:4-hydroxybenzoate polyprenyltransferase